MDWKSAAWLVIALFTVSFAAHLLVSIGHKNTDFQTLSLSQAVGMNNLSAEEINRRTLQLAATVKTSTR